MTLSNRDIASLIWLAVMAALVLSRQGGRGAIGGILRALLGTLVVLVAVYWVYLTLVVVVAWNLGFWNPDLTKDTVVWVLVPGLTLLFSFVRASKERGFYIRTLPRVVGLTALVEFYVNLGSFPLLVELVLVPVAAFLALMSTFAALKPEYAIVKRWVDRLMAVVGLAVLVGSGLYLASAGDRLDKKELALEFGTPVWLTAASLPFVFVFSLYALPGRATVGRRRRPSWRRTRRDIAYYAQRPRRSGCRCGRRRRLQGAGTPGDAMYAGFAAST
jgi:hypothetical protein